MPDKDAGPKDGATQAADPFAVLATTMNAWAAESVAGALNRYISSVQSAAGGAYTADTLTRDATKAMVTAQRDAARMLAGVGMLATALTGLTIE